MASRTFSAPERALTILAALALAFGVLVVSAPTAVGGPPSCAVSNTRTHKGYSSLQGAVSGAKAGDTLEVKGTCVGNTSVDRSITLKGVATKAFPGTPTLDGNEQGTVITIAAGTTTTIRNLAITNGKTSGFGGGIAAGPGSSLTLISSTVSENSAGSSGGIDSDGGNVTLIDSTVSNNTAAGATNCQDLGSCAGGIWNFGGKLTLIDSTVSGNTATRRGGGIVNQTPSGGSAAVLTLSGTTSITDNHAISDPTVNLGGGIWIRGGATVSATGDWTGSISGNTPDQCATDEMSGTSCT
jgi:hypothetical protein